MSILINESEPLKSSEDKIFASCVLPTPVWPKKIKDPIGLFGSLMPALLRWMAFTTFFTASSWPITFPEMFLSRLLSSFSSAFAILLTGMPVIIETTSEISFSSTVSLCILSSSCHFSCAINKSFSILFSSSLSFAASSYLCFLTTSFFLFLTSSRLSSRFTIFFGTSILVIWTLDPASSIASIALSGRNLSEIYLSVNFTHASRALSVKFTLWWDSYWSFMFLKISKVSSTVVGWTIIFWNLLSKAPSFSMYCLYSSRVVAPIHWISPLASAGLNIFEASKLPVAPPAPTIVWISSIKRMMSSFFSISFITAFILSSNCPLYFVPATILARSNVTTLLL